MKLLADESVDGPVIARLRRDGHEVAAIAEDSPGWRDEAVLARAKTEKRVLLTSDKDFGELVYRHRLPHDGVLLLRLSERVKKSKTRKFSCVSGRQTRHCSLRIADFRARTRSDESQS